MTAIKTETSIRDSALILIGYQNDYFSPDGILHSVIAPPLEDTRVLENTLSLLDRRASDFGIIISTPIVFTPEYDELVDPVGVLKTIKETGAFQENAPGGQTIDALKKFQGQLCEVKGKKGLNAFTETELLNVLNEHHIKEVILAGVVTSLCIDSTARSAVDNKFKVTILSDCTYGRSVFEQNFYCENIFPLYANVCTSQDI